jgi:short subunit dehydrogenase-like uncharacterized protein
VSLNEFSSLGDNIQDIVNSKNGQDIVNSIPWGFVDHDAVTSIIGHRN